LVKRLNYTGVKGVSQSRIQPAQKNMLNLDPGISSINNNSRHLQHIHTLFLYKHYSAAHGKHVAASLMQLPDMSRNYPPRRFAMNPREWRSEETLAN